MTQTLHIDIPASAGIRYPIWIGHGLLAQLPDLLDLSAYSKVALLTDENVAPHWLDPLLQVLQAVTQTEVPHLVLPAGEPHKDIAQVQKIWKMLQDAGCDRRSLLLNLGGGVIGDMGGFAASSYMRGIRFVQLPTTLLSQVDASVGGKVGINFGQVKNLIGAFQQPDAVLIDLDTLSSLPTREFHAGYAEVIKHALICAPATIDQMQKWSPDTLTSTETIQLVANACRHKARVVEQDQKEGGIRKILNFGHTIGHALESLSHTDDYCTWLHGEAVALGMVVEAEISRLQGMISAQDLIIIEALLTRWNLPTRWADAPPFEALHPWLLQDKKNVGGHIQWTLLRALGDACFDQSVALPLVQEAYRRLQAAPTGQEASPT